MRSGMLSSNKHWARWIFLTRRNRRLTCCLSNHRTLPSSRACVRGRAGVARHSARHPCTVVC